MQELLVIDKNIIKSMLNDERFIKEFPVFKDAQKMLNYNPPKAGCSRCQKRRIDKQKDRVINNTLIMISKMNAESRTKLKQLLNTKKAKINLTTNTGKQVSLTF